MAGLIPNDFIDSLIERSDIVEIIGNRIELKKKGKDHWACCPFHNENSASFSVNSVKQFYYCFGCGASGTALKFLQEYDSLNFVEAVEELARTVGVEVPREEQSQRSQQRQKQQRTSYDLMAKCAEYFEQQLYQHPNANQVQDYVVGRGLTEETVKTFQIGYAPSGWDNLIKQFNNHEQTNRELLTTGMLTQNEKGRIYDRFRERLMFPIRDIKGRVIGFGGRVMRPDDKPKYLNSPETPIFHKGNELYGLYEARRALKDFDNILIVEGYMDVVALAQQGIKNAVATLGTATTPTHIQKLFKQTSEVVFCFDGDAAGRRAAIRALSNTLGEIKDGLQAKFLFLPDGEDPDSLVQKEGYEAFTRRVKQAQSIGDFLFQHLQTQADVSRVDGRAKLASLAQGWLNPLADSVFKQLLFAQLSELIGLSVEQITSTYKPTTPELPTIDAAPIRHEYEPSSLPDDAYGYPEPAGLPIYAPILKRELSVRIGFTHRALAWLIRFPELAVNIELKGIQNLPASSERDLLLNVIELLQKAPKKDIYFAFDYLCQHGLRETLAPIASSDYLWLEAGNDQQQDERKFAQLELEKIIKALTQRGPDDEYETLKKRVLALDPNLSDIDKQRYRELLKQRKQ